MTFGAGVVVGLALGRLSRRSGIVSALAGVLVTTVGPFVRDAVRGAAGQAVATLFTRDA